MTNTPSAYRIGKVISVTGDQIFVSLVDHDSNEPASGVPASMNVDLPSATGPTPLLIGQPGTFVLLSLPAGYLLCMVTAIDMREERISSVEAKRAGEDDLLLIDRVSRVLTTVPVGTLDTAGKFEELGRIQNGKGQACCFYQVFLFLLCPEITAFLQAFRTNYG